VTNGLNKFVPTNAERAGDFSGVTNVVLDPSSYNSATQQKQPFASNRIPANFLDSASQGVLNYLPGATGTGQVFYSSPLHQNFHDVIGRADHVFSDKDHLNVRYNYQLFTNRPVYDASNILSYADGSDIVAQNVALQETHVFSPGLLNEFRVRFNRAAAIRGPANDVPSVRTFGVNIPYQPPANDIQSVNVSGFFNFGDNPFARFTRNNFLCNDSVRRVVGRHNISLGADVERRQVLLDNGFNSPGLFTFNGSSNTNSTGFTLSERPEPIPAGAGAVREYARLEHGILCSG
jgi:hypothetical protein